MRGDRREDINTNALAPFFLVTKNRIEKQQQSSSSSSSSFFSIIIEMVVFLKF